MGIHEEILRLALHGDDSDDDGGFEGSEPGTGIKSIVSEQLGLLKGCFQRLGSFDKNVNVYQDLFEKLDKDFGGLGAEGPKGWKKDARDCVGVGAFEVPRVWRVGFGEERGGEMEGEREGRGRRELVRRSTSWGVVGCGYGVNGSGKEGRRRSGKIF